MKQDIKKFEYYKMMEHETKLGKKNRGSSSKGNKRISGLDKLIHMMAAKRIRDHITFLSQSDSKKNRLFAKQLKLEKEYMRYLEKEELRDKIKKETGMTASGVYNLTEIGRVLGVSRERIRQIEAAALKILNHPSVGRALKEYQGEIKCVVIS
ncbi:MAG: hypothetical protein DRP57_04335 [Spirochaetes bacterium]|nr:MAG: hypothetical protein DRP57_04335 [Spirochaetota bacterium]